jgi:hypothetical protein
LRFMNINPSPSFDQFLDKLLHIPEGFSTGVYRGQRYKIIHTVENNGQVEKLFGENLRGEDHISFNLYRLASGQTLLKPCEMPAEKVQDFVVQVEIDFS